MKGGRRRLEPPAGVEPQAAGPPRRNRLSRSFRQSQAGPAEVLESIRSPREPEFKTPTRISRTRPGPSLDSPHNDPDLQQDIVWDATSPSPHRPGKRGKKPAAGGVVNISDIVSRIAPKHGRPRVTEPTLQQWIGDSAAIPCTPDPQAPRAKRRSPRRSGVEDLLRLARQLDRNLLRRDREEDQNLDLGENFSGPGPAGPEPQPRPDQPEDDLDFLFDGPTQKMSGNLSQPPTQNRPASATVCGSGPAVSRTGNKPGSVRNEFEDDWENDDLLNDSLVLEMTQNPLSFMVPKLCSTQRSPGPVSALGRVAPGQNPLGRVAPSVGTRTEKENLRPRATFQLEWSSGSGNRVQTDLPVARRVDSSPTDIDQNRSPYISGPQPAGKPGQTSCFQPGSRSDPRSGAGSTATLGSDAADFLDDDLDSLFSSEPVWDDPADDALLREMCDDLENRIQVQTVPSNQRAAGGAAGSSLAAGAAAQVKRPIRFLQPKPASFRTAQTNTTGSEPPAAQRPAHTQHFTFRRPGNLVTMATGKGKCSAAEIELKKQQALERRRRRLQAETGRPDPEPAGPEQNQLRFLL